MSGGHYNYACHRVSGLAMDIEQDIAKHAQPQVSEYGDTASALPADILSVMQLAADGLNAFSRLAHDIEWLLSGDYGDDTFRTCYAQWREGPGAPYLLDEEAAPGEVVQLRRHSAMLGMIAAIVSDYLPEDSELTTLDGVKRMQTEISRLRMLRVNAGACTD